MGNQVVADRVEFVLAAAGVVQTSSVFRIDKRERCIGGQAESGTLEVPFYVGLIDRALSLPAGASPEM
jgi:hypothetical protein